MRAAPAFRERLSDFEAANAGSFSSHCPSGHSLTWPGEGLTAVQTARVNDIGHLVELTKHPAQHLQVVNLNGHIDGCQLLTGIAAAGDTQHIHLLIGENGGDIAQ